MNQMEKTTSLVTGNISNGLQGATSGIKKQVV